VGYRLLSNSPGRGDPPHLNKTTHKTSGGSSINSANKIMTTTDEIYLKSEEIQNLQKTVSDMLNRLESESKAQGEDNYCQVVVQLNPQTDGKEWKMFIYFELDNNTFTYSYQDENDWDSDFYRSNTREFMLAKVLEEVKSVGGVQWIALDF
jgi:hypothetical protein